MQQYKATAPHSVTLATGRALAPGETADLDPTDPYHAALVEDGQLTAVQIAVEPKPARAKAATEEA